MAPEQILGSLVACIVICAFAIDLSLMRIASKLGMIEHYLQRIANQRRDQ
jgi:AraC-like DNA-binding protein